MADKPVFEKEDLLNVAKAQSRAIWFFLGIMLAQIANAFIPINQNNAASVWGKSILSLTLLGLVVYFFILIYRLAKALKKKTSFLYAIGMIIPLVNLLILVSLLGRATKVLKSGGLKVGLMGCSKGELVKLNK